MGWTKNKIHTIDTKDFKLFEREKLLGKTMIGNRVGMGALSVEPLLGQCDLCHDLGGGGRYLGRGPATSARRVQQYDTASGSEVRNVYVSVLFEVMSYVQCICICV